jgi:hypothetical protein
MDDIHDCWTCARFKQLTPGGSHECTADVKGGTMYDGWHPPCKNWEPQTPAQQSAAPLAEEPQAPAQQSATPRADEDIAPGLLNDIEDKD